MPPSRLYFLTLSIDFKKCWNPLKLPSFLETVRRNRKSLFFNSFDEHPKQYDTNLLCELMVSSPSLSAELRTHAMIVSTKSLRRNPSSSENLTIDPACSYQHNCKALPESATTASQIYVLSYILFRYRLMPFHVELLWSTMKVHCTPTSWAVDMRFNINSCVTPSDSITSWRFNCRSPRQQ